MRVRGGSGGSVWGKKIEGVAVADSGNTPASGCGVQAVMPISRITKSVYHAIVDVSILSIQTCLTFGF